MSAWNEVVFEAHEPVADVDQRRDGALQAEQVALQGVDPRGRGATRAVVGEDLFFDGLEIILELRDDREVLIDDEVHQRVEDVARPP